MLKNKAIKSIKHAQNSFCLDWPLNFVLGADREVVEDELEARDCVAYYIKEQYEDEALAIQVSELTLQEALEKGILPPLLKQNAEAFIAEVGTIEDDIAKAKNHGDNAIQAILEGDLEEALVEIDKAESIENNYGDAYCYRPAANAVKKLIESLKNK